MSNKKRYAIIMIVGVLMNQGLYTLAAWLHLPVWLDVTGTAFAAFALEPTAGLLVGLVNNFYLALFQYDSSSLIYYSISAAVALIWGCILRKDGKFRRKRVAPAIGLTILVSTALSVLFALWRTGGVPDVGWEYTAYSMALSTGMPSILATCCGTLFIKTLDTIATALCVGAAYKLLPQKMRYVPQSAGPRLKMPESE